MAFSNKRLGSSLCALNAFWASLACVGGDLVRIAGHHFKKAFCSINHIDDGALAIVTFRLGIHARTFSSVSEWLLAAYRPSVLVQGARTLAHRTGRRSMRRPRKLRFPLVLSDGLLHTGAKCLDEGSDCRFIWNTGSDGTRQNLRRRREGSPDRN